MPSLLSISHTSKREEHIHEALKHHIRRTRVRHDSTTLGAEQQSSFIAGVGFTVARQNWRNSGRKPIHRSSITLSPCTSTNVRAPSRTRPIRKRRNGNAGVRMSSDRPRSIRGPSILLVTSMSSMTMKHIRPAFSKHNTNAQPSLQAL
jgi:hypothetical protein